VQTITSVLDVRDAFALKEYFRTRFEIDISILTAV